VWFVRNEFRVSPMATHGRIFDSETTPADKHNRVQVGFLDCRFPPTWGNDETKLIANIAERGLWWFTPSSLAGRDPDVACPVKPRVSGIHRVVAWLPAFVASLRSAVPPQLISRMVTKLPR
jgi:hypothetical protein